MEAPNENIAAGIYNDGAFIKIVFKGHALLIHKTQVKTIDAIHDNIVRIDIGEGQLKHIYVRLADVVYPANLADVIALRDYIKDLLLQNEGGLATVNKQDQQTVVLNDIKNLLQTVKTNMENFYAGVAFKEPLRIDESQSNYTYKGYAAPNVFNENAAWAIQRISTVNNQTMIEWAEGNQHYDKVWDQRYSLAYFPTDYIDIK